MKKLLFLLALVGMIFTACEGSDGVEEDNGSTPFVPEITISPKDLTFGCNGGEQAVDITANFEYEVAERASWLTVEQTNEGLLVIVDANKNTSERSAFISITNSQYDINKSIEVYQEGYIPKIELAQQSIDVEFEPAEYEVAVTSPYSWKAESDNDWIVVESETGIAGEEVLRFSTKRNEEEKVRKGTITLKNTDYNLVAELYVTQKAFVPAITIEPESLTFAVEGGTQEVAITANFDEYEFSTNADWLTVEKSEKGVNITATQNTKFEECTAEITISSEKYGISKAITITQHGVSAEAQNVIIIYTSSDGKIVTPYKSDVFGANIVSNTYRDGQGLIIFDAPVTSIGYYAFYGCTSLTSITIGNSVTSIGGCAFRDCTSLTSVTIPDSVTSIGGSAFENCTSLTSVTIPDSVTSIGMGAFCGCTLLEAFYGKFASSDNRCLIVDGVLNSFAPAELTNYVIPDSVTSIGDDAFSGCSSLTSVTIPDSVTSIRYYAFRDCTSLTSVTIPDSVTEIGGGAFNSCTSLTSVTIPDSVTSIGEYAFYYCTSLTSVTIGNSVTEIGKMAFYECSGKLIINSNIIGISHSKTENITQSSEHWLYGSKFTDVAIGGKAEQVGKYAFYYYESLANVEIAEGVKAIRSVAFQGCSSLKNITLPNGVTKIWDSAFRECTSLKSIIIPDSVTSIGSYAFYDCTSLTSVTIGNSVTSIGKQAFYGCTGELIINSKIVETNYTDDNYPANSNNGWLYNAKFTKVTIGNSVTSIGYEAFYECNSLTSITIPDSVTEIGGSAFSRCTSLTRVYCKPTTPPTASADYWGDWDAFYNNAADRKIYVPRNSVEPYKSADGWSDYASDIVGYDF